MNATTKNGTSYRIRFRKLSLTNQYGIEPGHGNSVPAEMLVNDEWHNCELGKVKDTFVVKIWTSKTDLLSALNVPKEMWKKEVYIQCPPWHEAYEKFYNETIEEWEKVANSLTFEHVTFTHHTTHKYFLFNTNNEKMLYLVDHNDTIKALQAALKYISTEHLTKYCTGTDYDDYSISHRYQVPFSDIQAIIDFESPELLQAKADKVKAEAQRAANELKTANIAKGTIYFSCESRPHNEDLSGVILNAPAPRGGSFTIDHRIPKETFSKIAAFGRYWSKEFLEDCDMFFSSSGWRFTFDAVTKLHKDGIEVIVEGMDYETYLSTIN